MNNFQLRFIVSIFLTFQHITGRVLSSDRNLKSIRAFDYIFFHDGHCANGWMGDNEMTDTVDECATICSEREQCGYFAYDGTNCAAYFESDSCPDDNLYPNYNAYKIGNIAPSYVFSHDGHCASGWMGDNKNVDTVDECATICSEREQCGYFTYDDSKSYRINCATYFESDSCPDDNLYPEFDAYKISSITTPERLSYKSLPTTTSPGGRCMDGTMAGYYIRKGTDPNLFVINMNGGGYCNDPVKCADRARSAKGSSRYFSDSKEGINFLDSNCSTNPRFCHATHVHIPYCTSDAHRGTATPKNDGLWSSQYYFDGHSNFMAIVDKLVLEEGLNNSSNMKVLLTGTSAGALGVYFNIDKIKERVPLITVKGAPVAGWLSVGALEDDLPSIYSPSNYTMFVAGLKGNPMYHAVQEGLQLYDKDKMKESLSADCLDDYSESEWWVCERIDQAYRYIKAPLFHVHTLYDSKLIYGKEIGAAPKHPVSTSEIDNSKAYLEMYGEATRESLQQVLDDATNVIKEQPDGIFAASCLEHGTSDNVIIGGGYKWREIVNDWFFQNGQLTEYYRQVETCSNQGGLKLPCNSLSACQYQPSPLVETCRKAITHVDCLNENSVEQCFNCVKGSMGAILQAGCAPKRKMITIGMDICEDTNYQIIIDNSALVETCKEAMDNVDCLDKNNSVEQCFNCVEGSINDILKTGCGPRREARKIVKEICEDANSKKEIETSNLVENDALVETCKEAMDNVDCLNENNVEQCINCAKRSVDDILKTGCANGRKAQKIVKEICENVNSKRRIRRR